MAQKVESKNDVRRTTYFLIGIITLLGIVGRAFFKSDLTILIMVNIFLMASMIYYNEKKKGE